MSQFVVHILTETALKCTSSLSWPRQYSELSALSIGLNVFYFNSEMGSGLWILLFVRTYNIILTVYLNFFSPCLEMFVTQTYIDTWYLKHVDIIKSRLGYI